MRQLNGLFTQANNRQAWTDSWLDIYVFLIGLFANNASVCHIYHFVIHLICLKLHPWKEGT